MDIIFLAYWKKYGDVVSSYILGTWMVQLFSFDAIYEAFVSNADNFSERANESFGQIFPKAGWYLKGFIVIILQMTKDCMVLIIPVLINFTGFPF